MWLCGNHIILLIIPASDSLKVLSVNFERPLVIGLSLLVGPGLPIPDADTAIICPGPYVPRCILDEGAEAGGLAVKEFSCSRRAAGTQRRKSTRNLRVLARAPVDSSAGYGAAADESDCLVSPR